MKIDPSVKFPLIATFDDGSTEQYDDITNLELNLEFFDSDREDYIQIFDSLGRPVYLILDSLQVKVLKLKNQNFYTGHSYQMPQQIVNRGLTEGKIPANGEIRALQPSLFTRFINWVKGISSMNKLFFTMWHKKISILIGVFWLILFCNAFRAVFPFLYGQNNFGWEQLLWLLVSAVCCLEIYFLFFCWKYYVWSNISILIIDSVLCLFMFFWGKHPGFLCSSVFLLFICWLLYNEYIKGIRSKDSGLL